MYGESVNKHRVPGSATEAHYTVTPSEVGPLNGAVEYSLTLCIVSIVPVVCMCRLK